MPKRYSFCFQTLICITNFAKIISDVIQLMSKDVFIIRLQVGKTLDVRGLSLS